MKLSEIYKEELLKLECRDRSINNMMRTLDTITPQVAIDFAKWIVTNDYESYDTYTDMIWTNNYPDDWFTTEQLFELFLKQYKIS